MSELLPIKDPVLVFALVALLILLAPIVMGRWRLPGTIGLLLAGAILGPNALGVLARDQSFVLFGTVGLLYIMFTAALEIDMAVLRRYRTHSLVFGLLTFAIPQGVGTVVARYLLGFDWPAAILLASMFASHTLLAYPIVSRLGITRNPAVTAAVGGTIVTDTLALLVLAVIASATRGEMDDMFWYRLGASLTIYVLAILLGLPLLARWFFRNVERDGVSEFVFVLATVFGSATLAHVAGSEPIVGAFLAGLALNRLIPHNSTLMNRIRFTGGAVFIPFFLLSVGMLLDLRIFLGGPRAWAIAVGMVATVVLTKWLAAESTRLLLGYSRDQARVVFGLSVAQAAATLAATIVGYQIGLFDDAVVNGAILMILVTCVLAPWQVDRHGRAMALAIEQEDEESARPRQRILVALSKRSPTNPLLDLAMLVRDPEHRQPIFPLVVIEDSVGATDQVARAEMTLSRAVEQLAAADVSSQPLTRIDLNLAAGILRARRELRGTEVIVGWSKRTTAAEFFFGSILENLLADREYTLILSRVIAPLSTLRRVVLAVPPDADHEPGFPVAIATIKRLARQLGAGILVVTEQGQEERIRKRVATIKPQAEVRGAGIARWSGLVRVIGENMKDDDLLVLYGARAGGLAWRPAMGRLPARLAAYFPTRNLLMIYAAEGRNDPVPEVMTGSEPATLAPDFDGPPEQVRSGA
jgi:Kef-type K+ transport system membrane component KefB